MRVGAEQAGDLRTGRMAGDEQPLRIPAIFAGMHACPSHCVCGIFHERRKAGPRPGAVIRHDGEYAVLGQAMADEAVLLAVATLPCAAVEEHQGRGWTAAAMRPEHIERQPTIGCIHHGGVRSRYVVVDNAEEHALATAGKEREQCERSGDERAVDGHDPDHGCLEVSMASRW